MAPCIRPFACPRATRRTRSLPHGVKRLRERHAQLHRAFHRRAPTDWPRKELVRGNVRRIALTARDRRVRAPCADERFATRLKHGWTELVLCKAAHRLHAAGVKECAWMQNARTVARDAERGTVIRHWAYPAGASVKRQHLGKLLRAVHHAAFAERIVIRRARRDAIVSEARPGRRG